MMGADMWGSNAPRPQWDVHRGLTHEQAVEYVVGALASGREVVVSPEHKSVPVDDGPPSTSGVYQAREVLLPTATVKVLRGWA